MTFYAREHTDPAGGALTITTDHQGAWVTATEGREEVTVGPFPASVLDPAVPDTRTDEDQYEEAWRAAERAVLDEREMRKKGEQERDDARAMSSLWRETTRRALRDRNSWRSVARIGDHTSATLAERVKSLRTQVQAREARAEAVERERNEAEEALVDAREEARNADQLILVEQARAVKAEQERDMAREDRKELQERLAIQQKMAEQPRPLTPDAIESVLHDILPLSTEHLDSDDIANIAFDLHAALTEPTRPEGAEELAQLIATADVGEWDCGDLADALLATGRVRVVTEEQP